MNFDDLKNQWQADDADLDRRVQLNTAALRQQLVQQSQRGMRRLRWLKVAEVLSNVVMLVLLLLFCFHYGDDAPLLWCGIAVLMVQLRYAAVAWAQHRDLQALDYAQAVSAVQQQLERLRERRLQSVKHLVVLGFAVWPAFSIVLLKGLFGINLFRLLDDAAMLYYFTGGVLLALLLWLVWTAIAAITPQIEWLQAWRREAAGASLNTALTQLKLAQELETNTSQLPDTGMQHHLHQLRRAPLLAVYAKAVVMLLLGIGNAMHGGQADWMIPGVVLTVFFGTQIAFSAMQLTSLRAAKQAVSQATLQSVLNAYYAAVVSNVRWLTGLLPITFATTSLLIVKLLGVSLPAMTIVAIVAVALVASLFMTRSDLYKSFLRYSEAWINFVSKGALAKLKAALLNDNNVLS